MLLTLGICIVGVNPWIQAPVLEYAASVSAVIWVVIALRRALWKRYLILDERTISVPSGPLRLREKRVALRDIRRVWVVRLWATDILCVRTDDAQVEIQDFYLPDASVFHELRVYLESFVPTARA